MLQDLRRRKFWPIFWLSLSVIVVAADYITGPAMQFPILYIIPIALASWFNGRRWGLVLACGLPIFRIVFLFLWTTPWGLLETIVNAGIRIIVFSLLVFLIDHEVQRQALLKEVKVLKGLLPICSFCKKIRTQDKNWVPLENYIAEHSEAEFSHGFCPDCMKEHYGNFLPPGK